MVIILLDLKTKKGEVVGYLDKESIQKFIEELRSMLNAKEKDSYPLWESKRL